MDKNAIKRYAVWARRELIDRISKRAAIFGVTADGFGDPNAESINGHLLSGSERRQRQALIRQIEEKGYEQVMEEVAYTWFNRFAALRFMEVNGYLPSHIRVFTNDAGEFKPQILSEAIHLELDGLNIEKVYQLKDANQEEELFKYLLIVQCNALNSILPGMFQKIDDYTELLLPDYLLREGSIIEQMVTIIQEDDWRNQVQILGWLYQFYIAEPKDILINARKQYKTADIPFVTQLFTPDWIVHYMVENSLGRLWLEGHPSDELKAGWRYYLDEAEQEPEVQAQLAQVFKQYAVLKPEDILTIDPCAGSGHILCVLFDTLIRIYEDYGYAAREAAVSIVENNLWGLDIDDRAAQLANFAVMMKARQYDRRFFMRNVQPHVYAIHESNSVNREHLNYLGHRLSDIDRNNAFNQINALLDEFIDAKEFGSIIQPREYDWALLSRFVDDTISDQQMTFEEAGLDITQVQLRRIITQGQILAKKHHVVVTNPPYMANKYMPNKLRTYVSDNYDFLKSDLFAVFIKRCRKMCVDNGQMGFLTPYVWMFIQSYEEMRDYFFRNMTLSSLIQLEYNAFEAACVPVATFTVRNYCISSSFEGIKLSDFRGADNQEPKALEAIQNRHCGYRYTASQKNFSRIPGSPVAYWVSQAIFDTFSNPPIQTICTQKTRISTGDNDRFMRKWYEVPFSKMMYPNKWIPCPKGGDFRKWYGNIDLVLNWENDGDELTHFPKAMLGDRNYFLKPGLTWTVISSTKTGFRVVPAGCICDHKGPLIFVKEQGETEKLLGLLNSRFSEELLKVTAPTIGFEWGAIAKTPWLGKTPFDQEIRKLVHENVELSKADWDSFETSWDFCWHPLVGKLSHDRSETGTYIKDHFEHWEIECNERFLRLKKNEEELNSLINRVFHLEEELPTIINDEDVTVHRSDLNRDIRSLISYAVGCMLGRYSLNNPGLIFAGGIWDVNQYNAFPVDTDGILPITDDEYFYDDIVTRFVDWVKVVYGVNTLEENLSFIASALNGKGSPRDVIRSYFLNDFYKDHIKVYQKKPIYWLFDSGKKNSFKALIYMHRYQPDTIARLRTDYVHEMQSRYRTAIKDIEQRMNDSSTSDRVKLTKHLSSIQAQADELRSYEEKVHHLADQMIPIDIDDGVTNNYSKFSDILAKIK